MMFAVAGSQSRLLVVQIALVMAMVGLPLGADALAPPPVEHKNFMVLPAKEGSTTCEYSTMSSDSKSFLGTAAKLLGGTGSSCRITGPKTIPPLAAGATRVKVSGGNVAGTCNWVFSTHAEALNMHQLFSTFMTYLNTKFVCTSVLEPVTVTVAGITFKAEGGQQTCSFSLSPQGSDTTPAYKAFLSTAAALHGAVETKLGGNVQSDPDQPVKAWGPKNGLYTAKMSGSGIGGSLTFRFDSMQKRDDFKDLLTAFKRYFNPKFDCSPAERRLEDPSIILA